MRTPQIIKNYFPGSFEMFMAGFIFLLASMPGLAMIFIRHDSIFPGLSDPLYDVGVAWGCITALLAMIFIFWGLRTVSSPGTIVYRLTHPRLF